MGQVDRFFRLCFCVCVHECVSVDFHVHLFVASFKSFWPLKHAPGYSLDRTSTNFIEIRLWYKLIHPTHSICPRI